MPEQLHPKEGGEQRSQRGMRSLGQPTWTDPNADAQVRVDDGAEVQAPHASAPVHVWNRSLLLVIAVNFVNAVEYAILMATVWIYLQIIVSHGNFPRWVLRRPTIVIPRSMTPERIVANLDVFGFELDAAQMAALDALDKGFPEGCFNHPKTPWLGRSEYTGSTASYCNE